MIQVVLFINKKRATDGRPYEQKLNFCVNKKTKNGRISRLTALTQKFFVMLSAVETSRRSRMF